MSWDNLASFCAPPTKNDRATAPPPASARAPKVVDAEAEALATAAPASARDDLLAAFLADAPIEGSMPPPAVPVAPAPVPAAAPKRAEKVTVRRDK